MTKAKLTPVDVAIKTGYSLMHIYVLLRSGQIPGAMKVDGEWRIPAGVFEARRARRSKNEKASASTEALSNRTLGKSTRRRELVRRSFVLVPILKGGHSDGKFPSALYLIELVHGVLFDLRGRSA